MHLITRRHEIDAGHRVVGHGGKCAYFHGHRYGFALTCAAPVLDRLGMVVDFAVIKERLCGWLDRCWDHRMLLWERDPSLLGMQVLDGGDTGIVPVPFNPTAENMAAYLVKTVGPEALRGTGVRLVACTVHETGKCSATYVAADAPAMPAMGWTE